MENSVKILLTGNWTMALCGVFYLAWWVVVFRPPKPRNSPVGWALLALAVLAGIAGFYLMGRTLAEPVPEVRPGIRGLWISLGGAVAYALLLAGTTLIFHRQVTSELLIIVAWTVLELCTISFLYRCGGLPNAAARTLAGIVLAAAVASLICYLLYTSFQDLRGLEGSESQRLQALEQSGGIFSDFGVRGQSGEKCLLTNQTP